MKFLRCITRRKLFLRIRDVDDVVPPHPPDFPSNITITEGNDISKFM